MVSLIVSSELPKKKDLKPCGEETSLMSSDISPLKLLTSLSKISSRRLSIPTTLKPTDSNSSSEILPQEVPLELPHFALFTPLISLELDLLPMLDQENKDNSLDL